MTYEHYIANVFGLFGVTDYDVARRMTLTEYNLRLQGYIVATIEKEYFSFFSAFAHRKTMATNKEGKPIYKELTDLYDKEKRRSELLDYHQNPVNQKLVKIARNLREFRQGGRV